ncbi:MAG: M28 family metallopeptidase [Candidatus Angelobacter sp.]
MSPNTSIMQSTAISPEVTAEPGETLRAAPPLTAITLLFFVLCSAIVIALDAPPPPVMDRAPLSAFSAERAVKHVAVIGRAPHPINSTQHDTVRDYILNTLRQIGVTAQVQRTTDVNERYGVDGAVENIVCRLPGTTREKAVLLVGHYDSVAAGPGASDDGVAVAALLESARAFKLLPQLKRDVIILFTDGEEEGLIGARAFVSEHPWAHDVGLVLNFEARGTRGPSLMFETSNENGWLISNFGRAASHPAANSLSYEIYKRMPNDTDFTIFRRAGYSGLNFAFIDGLASYHTARDSSDAVNLGSLQHHGDYMMELTRQFGNAASDDTKQANAVYFDVLGQILVRYSRPASIFLCGLAGVLFVITYFLGLRSQSLRIGPSLVALVFAVLGIVILAAGAEAAAWLTSAVQSPRIHAGLMSNTGWYILAFSAIGLACCLAMYSLVVRRIGPDNLMAGGVLMWLCLSIAVTIYFAGASYLFVCPLLFVLLGWMAIVVKRHTSTNARSGLLALSGIPAIVLMVPMMHKIVWAFSVQSTLIVSVLLGLLLALLIGPIGLDKASNRWQLPAVVAALGLGLLIAAIAVSRVATEDTYLEIPDMHIHVLTQSPHSDLSHRPFA